jgi:hypothetical protein
MESREEREFEENIRILKNSCSCFSFIKHLFEFRLTDVSKIQTKFIVKSKKKEITRFTSAFF